MARRIDLTTDIEAALRAAYPVATSGRDFAARVGLSQGVCARLATLAGLQYPNPAWGAKSAPLAPPPVSTEEAVAEDVAVDREATKAKHYRTLYRAAKRQLRAQEDLWDAIVETFARPLPSPAFIPRSRGSVDKPRRDAILQLGDWHVGQLVTPEESGGMGHYDYATFNASLARLLDATEGSIKNQLRSYDIRRLIIAIVVDMVEGHYIFTGQAYHLEMDAMQQVVLGADAFGRFIIELRKRLGPFIEVIVVAVPGNHGKPGGRKSGATPVTYSFDWLFLKWLKREVANAGLRDFVIEPGGKVMFETAGHTFLMFHGQEIRGWGGFPYYGLDKTDGRLLRETGQHFDFLLLGHFHQAAIIPAGKGHRIVNGSAVGANQLTEAAVLLSTLPEQNLLFISPEHGLAEVAYLYLDKKGRERRRTVHTWPLEHPASVPA